MLAGQVYEPAQVFPVLLAGVRSRRGAHPVVDRLSRPRIRKRGCMPLAMAAALTLWRHWMGEVSYGLFLLPLFGALGAWLGNVGGEFFERYTRTGNAKNG